MAESKNLWGGRFEGKTDPGFAEFNNSFRFDRRLFEADVVASIAYCAALESAGVLRPEEGMQIRTALDTIIKTGRQDDAYFNDSAANSELQFSSSATICTLSQRWRIES